MIQKYLDQAMQAAHYELLEDNEGFYGELKTAPGIRATGNTLETCLRNS